MLGALSLCINTALTLIYGELLFNDLNFWYSRKFVPYSVRQGYQILANFLYAYKYLFLRLLRILINWNGSNFSKIPVDLEVNGSSVESV